jgi:hypothetical protein
LLFKIFLLLIPLVLLLLPAYILISAIQPQALVGSGEDMRPADVGRIKGLIKQNDPRQLRDGEVRRLNITERDLNLILAYTLRQISGQSIAIELAPQTLRVDYSYTMPRNPLGKYLNVSVALMQSDGTLMVRQVALGEATVPEWMLNPVVNVVDRLLREKLPEYAGVIAAIKDLRLQEDEVQVIYQWHSGLADQIQSRGRDFLLPHADRQRILAYYELIAEQSKQLSGNTSMAVLLQPLFALAEQRSNKTGNERAENRALLLALGLVVNRSSPDRLLGFGDRQVRVRPDYMRLTLAGRTDLAQHFVFSAAITAAGGSGLADAVGIFKELDDSRGGSGFSFVDLLADRAGVGLANIALGPHAKQVQRGMAASLYESDFMPSTRELPEGLMELEFKSRYVDLDSAKYQRVNSEISDRISSVTIHQQHTTPK